MAYSSDIADLLADQIAKFVTLNRHQLVGHAANLDFWAGEVRHCLDVIDGYERRFEQMKTAQMQYVSEHGTIQYDLRDTSIPGEKPPPPRRVPGGELRKSRQRLCEATRRFLVRCFDDELISEATLRRVCGRLGIDGGSS